MHKSSNLTGKFVMPGIINLHGHLGNIVDLTQDPKIFTRENVEKNLNALRLLRRHLYGQHGQRQGAHLRPAPKQRAGRPLMTRIFTAGRGFTGDGGYPTTVPGKKGVPFEVANEVEIEKDVAWLADKKVDLVKIWVDDHLGREKKIPLDLCKAIIEDAHKNQLQVAAHVFYLDDAKALVDAGLDGLAHSVRDKPVDDELIEAMKKHGAIQTATLTREASLFAFAKPSPMLNDPFFTRGFVRQRARDAAQPGVSGEAARRSRLRQVSRLSQNGHAESEEALRCRREDRIRHRYGPSRAAFRATSSTGKWS